MRLLLSSLLAALCFALPAAAHDVEALTKKRDAKLAEDWFTSNGWTSDYDQARKKAKESGKVIFAYFTRSYAY